jgi:hypothetical protein
MRFDDGLSLDLRWGRLYAIIGLNATNTKGAGIHKLTPTCIFFSFSFIYLLLFIT